MAKSVKKLPGIELAQLKDALDYNQKTGEFVWRIRRNSYGGKIKIGSIAGTRVLDRDGGTHINIGVRGKHYRAHHLAWAFMKGEWPKGDIDHKDGVRTHNWWKNLRPATRGQNNANCHKLQPNNISGKTGVSWVARLNKWMSRIVVNGTVISLGLFARDELDKAIAARRAAELKYWGVYAPSEVVIKELSSKELKTLVNAKLPPKIDTRSVSGKTGVNWVSRECKWRVTIHVDGKSIYIGFWPRNELDKAIKARRAAELKYYGYYLKK
jgi:hypothetical protein